MNKYFIPILLIILLIYDFLYLAAIIATAYIISEALTKKR